MRYDEGDILHFEVEDSGIGIPEAEQDKIFAMYYQVKDSHGGKPATGTGIGLAVSRRLARNMGGDISVTSQPGKGATFTLTVHAPAIAEEVEDTLAERRHAITGAATCCWLRTLSSTLLWPVRCWKNWVTALDVAMTGKAALEMFDAGRI